MIQKRARFVLFVYLSALLTVFLYIFQHEFGHMIVLLSVGARITQFSILGAHVNYTGGNFTDCSALWMHANGAFFPLVFSYFFLLRYNKNIKNQFCRILALFMGIIPSMPLFAWIVIPFTYMNGNAPFGDDVTKFLDIFSRNHSPLLVSAGAAVLLGISVVLFIRKRVPQNFWAELKSIRQKPENECNPE